ncbi:hypothetical protein BKA83DRAFT_4479434 [Pisolithus microcarpus]|nr:hypothetical protein BKA83DRAFT_4479434 [Pisolithus microcarpus]
MRDPGVGSGSNGTSDNHPITEGPTTRQITTAIEPQGTPSPSWLNIDNKGGIKEWRLQTKGGIRQATTVAHVVFKVGNVLSAENSHACICHGDVFVNCCTHDQCKVDHQNAAHDYTWNQLKSNNPREATPITKPSDKVAQKSVTIIENYEGRPCSPSSSELSESTLWSRDENEESDRGKIPKPNGKVGWPGRRSYNLEDQLGWGKDGFGNLKRFIKKTAKKKHLEPTKCWSLQDHQALETVNKTAIAEFPDLDDFECWPVQDLVQLQLKYSSFRARRQKRDRLTLPCEIVKTNTRRSR